MPQILPGQTLDWVNDQMLATGTPKAVDVKVGVSQETLPPNPPQIEASEPKLKNEPVTGLQVEGTATNGSSI